MTHRAPPGLGASQHRRLVDRALLHPRATAALWVALPLSYLLAGELRGCLRGCDGFDCGGCGPVGSSAGWEL